MITPTSVDVVIIGAGPAGCCAALRLLALGHRVAIVEQASFPRGHIGESLSPGVWGLLDSIDATCAIDNAHCLRDVPAKIIWEHREAVVVSSQERGPGVLVDRAQFDARLLDLAAERGAWIFQPAQIRRTADVRRQPTYLIVGESGAKRVETPMHARLVLDARGRSARTDCERLRLAPSTVAMWTYIAGDHLPRETCIEAREDGWLWGAPTPDGRYRIIAFSDLANLRKQRSLEAYFRALVAEGRLLANANRYAFLDSVRACSATPFLDRRYWRDNTIKLGENVLALDPLSSSGVEKAMRLGLLVAIVANTVLRDPTAEVLAKEFYYARLLESAATHLNWATDYYGQAWPGCEHAFWRARSLNSLAGLDADDPLVARLNALCANPVPQRSALHQAGIRNLSTGHFAMFLAMPITMSSEIRFVEEPCIMEDLIQLRTAVVHPSLGRPVAFLAGYDLAPLLQALPAQTTLLQILSIWSSRMPISVATRIASWLTENGILEVSSSEPSRHAVLSG